MSTKPPRPAQAPITTVPLGFAAQLRALSDHQSRLESRITSLEHENWSLKSNLSARIAALEARNAHLSSRRRKTVAQFLNLQSLHQDAGNAFHLRSQDIQEEDLEGILDVWAGSVNMVLNHHQRILGRGQGQGQFAPQAPMAMRQQMGWQYPMGYNEAGYCRAHGVAYWCRACGQ
ncbi:hypothetical protein BDU57DRAFT_491949 [Ampelomyces quisqualis]|uniref:Uncharacterized protein n=1 Tax=Ampelomyces quisqualis TaxID=50730 RepID=A0A6A5QY76_AMPQU|nr:hypothetical protein BDU57DRAFT_491949 [Ampelomyces quisqualis]